MKQLLIALACLPAMACATSAPTKTDAPPDTDTAAPTSGAQLQRVILKSDTSPLVSVRVLWRVGAINDPAGKEGLAALTARMMARGASRSHTWAELLDAYYPMAASVSVSVDKEVMVLSGTVHKDNARAFLDLVAEQILHPAFEAEDFKRLKNQATKALTQGLRSDDDEELGKHGLEAALYAGHPYSWPSVGTEDGLASITLADVRAFYAGHLTNSSNLLVGLAGGFDDATAKAFVDTLKALPARGYVPVALPERRAAAAATNLHPLFIDKDSRATAISMGHPIPLTRADDDFYPLFLVASYLGEHRTFNGILMQRMRGVRGLNYGDYAYAEKFVQDGWSTLPRPNIYRRHQHFEVWIRPVAPHNALFAARQAIYELRNLVRDGIPKDGFESTRDFLMNFNKLWTQSDGRRLGYAMDAALYGKDLAAELDRRLPTMTLGDVNRVIRTYLKPDALTIVFAGPDAAKYAQELAAGDATPITYDTEGTPQKVLDEDARIEALKLPIDGAPVIVPVAEMFKTPALPQAATVP